ncbi:hypothetical protein Tco_0505856 [Tanacetum coccineum]
MAAQKFANSHNMVAFLEKPAESDGFEQIVDFLNAHTIKYALTVNPTIYTSCIEQFWATAKVKTVNEEKQLQALVDRKKVVITESTIRRDLRLEDAEVFINQQLGDMSTYDEIYVTPSHTKKVFGNMKRVGKGFSRAVTPLFPTIMVQAHEEMGEADEIKNEESVPIHSNDQLLSGEDSIKVELMEHCTKLQQKLLDLEHTKTTQALEIESLKRRVKKLEKKHKSRTYKLKRLYKERKIPDIDAEKDITLENVHDVDMFGVQDLDGDEVFIETKESMVNAAVVNADTTTTKLKTAKPKAVIIAVTTTTTAITRPKAKGLVIQEQEQASTPTPIVFPQQLMAKDKAEFDEEARLTREKEEANTVLIEEWDDIQAKFNVDHQLAKQFQAQEQKELTDA